MQASEMMTVLRLGLKHNVKNEMIWKHFEAQIHKRLYKYMNPKFTQEKLEDKQKIDKMSNHFEKNHQDSFQILTDQFKMEQQQESKINLSEDENKQKKLLKVEKSNEQNQKNVQTQLERRNNQQDIYKQVYNLVQILIWYGCMNVKLLNFLLQTLLHPSVLIQTPQAVLIFAELITYTCQVHIKIYQNNKKDYTTRSIKGIYKFQGVYLQQLFKNLKLTLSAFTREDLQYFTSVMGSFPVKKRAQKKFLVYEITNEWKKRNLQISQDQQKKLQEIVGNDAKLIADFHKILGKQGENTIQQQVEISDNRKQEVENEQG